MADTIFALSSGSLPSGVAIIRLSGQLAKTVGEQMTGGVLAPRLAGLRRFADPVNDQAIDEGLVLFFPAPNSFTGEDVVEFHCHGGVATVSAMLDVLGGQKGLRPAEAGEFSRRAPFVMLLFITCDFLVCSCCKL